MQKSQKQNLRPRLRETGILIGSLPTGPQNSITDIPGVKVGHTTLIEGDGIHQPGKGPVRTGVTVILPHSDNLYRKKVQAAVHTINGHGKVQGFEQVRELGLIESPIALTNAFNVGLVADGLIEYMISQDKEIGATDECLSLNVVVGETNDSFLNDMQGRHIKSKHVRSAILSALRSSDPTIVEEGSIGAGTGTHCFYWKGGIGTASRKIPIEFGGYLLGALVQSNFGLPEQLIIDGRPVGRFLQPPPIENQSYKDQGSIMIVLATNAPVSPRQLHRLSQRATVGLARTGSMIGQQSGDFVIAFSTDNMIQHGDSPNTLQVSIVNETRVLPWLMTAVVESVEEAILNSMFRATTTTGRNNQVLHALPIQQVLEQFFS